MPDITKIKIGNERERSYKDFPANREFKKRAEDDNPGGGWPADLPKPSVGGYGYTEQGEQTVITWDGDIEGKLPVVGADFTGYKVSEVPQNYTPSVPFNKVVYNGIEYNDIDSQDISAQYGAVAYFTLSGNWGFYVCVDAEKGSVIGLTETGVYFPKTEDGYISAASYGTPDTIHKIDEKYLPASGGAMVVNIEREYDTMVADKPFDEVYSAWKTGCVIARVDTGNGIVDLRPLTDVTTDTTTGLVFTGVTYTAEHGILYKLNWGSFSGVEKFNLADRKLQLADI